jgi:putative acetyltransferase
MIDRGAVRASSIVPLLHAVRQIDPGMNLQEAAITPATAADLPRLVEVWEASVRATHHFLAPGDVEVFRPLVRQELAHGETVAACARDEAGAATGFVGVAEEKVEMLFIHPNARGRGIGRALLRHAVEAMGATRLDVNEQNEQAVGFYLRMGFEVEGRSERDGLGKPYPLLHMRLGDSKPGRNPLSATAER